MISFRVITMDEAQIEKTKHDSRVYRFLCYFRIVLAELIRLVQRERDNATLPKRAGSLADRSSLLNNQVFRQEITTIIVVLTLRCRRPMIDIQVQIIQLFFPTRDVSIVAKFHEANRLLFQLINLASCAKPTSSA